MNKQTGLAPILIVLLIATAIGGYLIYSGKINLPQKQVACTMDAKVCPDGTSVGRSGPKCEFAPCPSPKTDETANWETYTDTIYGFEIKIPEKWEYSSTGGFTRGNKAIADSLVATNYKATDDHELMSYDKKLQILIETNNKKSLGEIESEYKTTNGTSIENIETINLDSQQALKIDIKRGPQQNSFPTNQNIVILNSKGEKYTITLFENSVDKLLFNQILSTFKFTN